MSDNKELVPGISPDALLPSKLSVEERSQLTEKLNSESGQLLTQLANEVDVQKTADLTMLFNINHQKKAMIRQEKLDDVMDALVDNLADRAINHRDEFDNDTLLRATNTIHTIMEKNSMTINQNPQTPPLITVTHNEVNIGGDAQEDEAKKPLNSSSRKNVADFIQKSLKSMLGNKEEVEIIDMPTTEIKNDQD